MWGCGTSCMGCPHPWGSAAPKQVWWRQVPILPPCLLHHGSTLSSTSNLPLLPVETPKSANGIQTLNISPSLLKLMLTRPWGISFFVCLFLKYLVLPCTAWKFSSAFHLPDHLFRCFQLQLLVPFPLFYLCFNFTGYLSLVLMHLC